MDGAAIESALAALGQPYERIDPATWRANLPSDSHVLPLFVRLTNAWVFLVVTPFAKAAGLPPDRQRALYAHLLVLNRAMNMAKFALDGEHDVVLSVELPTENLHPTQLQDGACALGCYADRYHDEVTALASP
jgi:hypothetical protein